jgi:hypothetical protein
MANKLFQLAREAVQQAVGKIQASAPLKHNENTNQTNLSGHDMEVAQNLLSSAMANSSDAERAQLAELQKELEGHSTTASVTQQSTASSQQESLSADFQDSLESDQQNS